MSETPLVDSRRIGMLPTYREWYLAGHIGHVSGAIDVRRICPLEAFRADPDGLLRALKASPKAEGERLPFTLDGPA